jgi:hypothetical protein
MFNLKTQKFMSQENNKEEIAIKGLKLMIDKMLLMQKRMPDIIIAGVV